MDREKLKYAILEATELAKKLGENKAYELLVKAQIALQKPEARHFLPSGKGLVRTRGAVNE